MMFACLYSLSAPQSLLVGVAEVFTPRYEIVGPLVLLDLTGLSRLFGSPREIGAELRRSMGGAAVRMAIAPSQTAAAILALGTPGLTVVSAEEQPAVLASLPVMLLGDLDRLRKADHVRATEPQRHGDTSKTSPNLRASVARTSKMAPHIGETSPKRPEGREGGPHANCALRQAQGAVSMSNGGGDWSHPRDAHAAGIAKRARRTTPITTEHPHVAEGTQHGHAHVARGTWHVALKDIQSLLETLRRWGITTLGALAALPPGEVYERLGARAVTWQRLARGEDYGPMVPCVPEDPFEAGLDLEWPIEGLEPLSFVLARLFEPLAERLERADRGAAILHTHLRLTTRGVYARTVQLPAPMRDPKTLRTLALLDLESNPPSAAIDRVRVLIEPTPARVLQWTLYARAQPSPEQVSTLVARLTALMGEGHVGSPRVLDSWKPGAFALDPFQVTSPEPRAVGQSATPESCGTALRRFRLPVPARVQVQEGRPVRVLVDRRGVTGGAVEQSAGPWRTSGEWWNDGWDRDEWDILLKEGPAYRIYVEREVGQWFIEGVVD